MSKQSTISFKMHYIMNKLTILLKKYIYHAEIASFMNNPLYHFDNHYIIQTLTISCRNYIILYVKTRVKIYTTELTSSYTLKYFN